MPKADIIHELHAPARRNYARRKVAQRGLNETWQIDLVELQPHASCNKGIRYILTVIDIFSKYAYAIGVKNKDAVSVTEAMEEIFRRAKTTPKNIHSDQGKEFFNSKFKNLMKEHDINHYHTFSIMKASICERFNRTLKERMFRQFSLQGNYKWINILDQLVKDYNNAIHRTIKMRPVDVNSRNEKKLLRTVYAYRNVYKHRKDLKINDFVRISKNKGVFEKGYTPNWSTELFQIIKVQHTNPTTYLLKDYNDEEIQGAFYRQELRKTKITDQFLVENILRRKGNKVYVKWLGFDSAHNSWINKNDVL